MKLRIGEIYDRLLTFLLPYKEEEAAFLNLSAAQFLETVSPSAPLNIADAKAMFSYNNKMVKQAIWLLKFKNDRKAARILSEIMSEAAAEWLHDLLCFENFASPIIVPVPMSKNRRKERGGDHTLTLCQKMTDELPIGTAELVKNALIKIRETESQVKTRSKTERLSNLMNSFGADPNLVSGRNIVLIDDVITTGATVEECRKTLMASDAKRVIALAIAH
ncbi:MAG: ComF family protein [Candidatus Taylorbacteria bacterium]|nr:ComF family protein [Candidatus Taylorbacteria bacterium]